MSQDLARPAWMEDRLGEAITRLTTRMGDANFTALAKAATLVGQWGAVQELLACSDFFAEQVARQHEWLCGALADGTLLEGCDWMAQDWDRALYALLPSTQSEPEALAALRIFRHREMVRILWRDHAQLARLEEAFEALSQLADCCIRAALNAGRLYEVDLRLRPDGDSGLVATTLPALRRYQLESAWVWEHQALVRSRVVAGDSH